MSHPSPRVIRSSTAVLVLFLIFALCFLIGGVFAVQTWPYRILVVIIGLVLLVFFTLLGRRRVLTIYPHGLGIHTGNLANKVTTIPWADIRTLGVYDLIQDEGGDRTLILELEKQPDLPDANVRSWIARQYDVRPDCVLVPLYGYPMNIVRGISEFVGLEKVMVPLVRGKKGERFAGVTCALNEKFVGKCFLSQEEAW